MTLFCLAVSALKKVPSSFKFDNLKNEEVEDDFKLINISQFISHRCI